MDIIEDHCPHALPTEIVDSESILFQQVDSSDPKHSTSLLSDALGNQKEQNLAAKLQEAESNLLAEQERTASVIAKYRCDLYLPFVIVFVGKAYNVLNLNLKRRILKSLYLMRGWSSSLVV